jgi:hypothetical protein
MTEQVTLVRPVRTQAQCLDLDSHRLDRNRPKNLGLLTFPWVA